MPGEWLRIAFWKRVAAARNARFRSALHADGSGRALLLSPHLDDAVLDCWSVLTGPGEVEVVNVFGQGPQPGFVSDWDRVLGASDSAALFSARIAEDAEALGLAGRAPRNLPFTELQYRRGRPFPLWRAIDEKLAAALPRVGRILAPAAIGTVHPDHALIRAYALALAAQGHDVTLYADVPYAALYGWPAWVTGAKPRDHLDIDHYWAGAFDDLPVEPGDARVVELDEAAAAAKLEAMRTYRTQFPTLDRGPVGQLSNPAVHRYELFWDL